MRPKRGTDHSWKIVKYKGDIALYAKCKCGFRYACSESERNKDGTFSVKQKVSKIYPYCPVCGARKKFYDDTNITHIDRYPFE